MAQVDVNDILLQKLSVVGCHLLLSVYSKFRLMSRTNVIHVVASAFL